jgi:hypothetical protein
VGVAGGLFSKFLVLNRNLYWGSIGVLLGIS